MEEGRFKPTAIDISHCINHAKLGENEEDLKTDRDAIIIFCIKITSFLNQPRSHKELGADSNHQVILTRYWPCEIGFSVVATSIPLTSLGANKGSLKDLYVRHDIESS